MSMVTGIRYASPCLVDVDQDTPFRLAASHGLDVGSEPSTSRHNTV